MPDFFYIYPAYLTSPTRAQGRRVSKAHAVRSDLTKEELLAAVQSLGFTAEAENKSYPRSSWKEEGRVKVTKKKGITKEKLLDQLGAKLSAAKAAPPR